ncbi:MAG: hypothetical protein J0H19_20405 [Rhodospirillales bacterium]|nr:hypothetical protein [Rhodospirillales bacterium]
MPPPPSAVGASSGSMQGDGRGEPGATALRSQARRQSVGIVLLVVALSFATWAGAVVLRHDAQTAALARARVESENLGAGIADQVGRELDELDGALETVVQRLRVDPAQLEHRTGWERPLTAIRGVTHVAVITPDGQVQGGPGQVSAPLRDAILREHMPAHAAGRSAGMLVGRAVTDPATRQRVIPVSRRLETVDHRFLGVLLVFVAAEAFGPSLPQLDLGPRGLVALVGADGTLRAVLRPPRPGAPPTAQDRWGPASPAAAGQAGEEDERALTVRPIAAHGLSVLVEPDLDAWLAPFRLQGSLIAAGASFVTLAWIGIGWLLLSAVWDRTRLVTRLIDMRTEMNAALAAERGALAATRQALDQSRVQAEAATLAKSCFLAQMSHELRTPLHAMIGFAEIIRDQAPPQSAATLRGYAQQIWSAARGLLELINAMLEFARIEGGSAQLVESVVRVPDLVRATIAMLAPQAAARGVTLRSAVPDQVPALRADPGRLRQILANLLSNAVRFGRAGSVATLSVAETPAGGLVFIFADQGEGMTPVEIAIALEPFGQVDASLARREGGAGLGLPLAKALVELHGGTLRIESRKGEGTTVEVAFPPERTIRHTVSSVQT